MKNKETTIILSVAILAAGLFVSHYLVTNAQTAGSTSSPQATASSTLVSLSSLQYPIAALGNCSSVSDCRAYCNNPANESACLAFAEQNHLMTQEQVQRAQSFLSLIQSGGTPGNCSSTGECRTYCSDASHASECLAFAEREGFVSHAQVQAIQANAGKGPGGCDSEESCTAFCNNPGNQSACLDFAKRNGLISEVQAQNIEESAAGLRIGLAQFPGRVVGCLKGDLGDNAVGELESGNLVPNASTSAVVSSCFSAYKSQIGDRLQSLLESASTTVQSCLEGVGSSTLADLKQGNLGAISSDAGEKIRECLNQGKENGQENEAAQQQVERVREQIQNQLENLPDRVKNCVEPYVELNPTTTNIGQIISNCMRTYGTSTGPGEGEGSAVMPRYSENEGRPFLPATSSNGTSSRPNPLPLIPQQNRGGDN